MNFEEIIPLLTNNAPLDIFKKIVGYNQAVQSGSQRARVRIVLSSGFYFEGTPLKIDENGNVIFVTANIV